MGTKSEIQFKGGMDTAKSCATQLLLSLRLGKGRYKDTDIKGPTGENVKVYYNPDKNGAQIRKEIQGKIPWEVIRSADTSKELFYKRENGTVYVDRRPLAQIQIVSEEAVRVSWMHNRRGKIGMDDAAIEKAFKTRNTENMEQWS